MWGFFLFLTFCTISRSYLAPCSPVVGLDIQDEMGRHEVGHIDNSMKIPLNQGDGCRFEGEFSINKVRLECLFACLWSGGGPPPVLPTPRASDFPVPFTHINPAVVEIFGIREAFWSQAPLSFQLSACVRVRAHSWCRLIAELNALQVPPLRVSHHVSHVSPLTPLGAGKLPRVHAQCHRAAPEPRHDPHHP